jgi:hypothetical protein
LTEEKSSQSFDKEHFIPSILEPLIEKQDQRIAIMLNKEINLNIFLGLVTKGYVFNTVSLNIKVSCGAETLTRISNKYEELSF